MLKVSVPNLLAELKSLKYDAKVQEETNQVFFIFKHEKREFPLFIRLIHDGELVQILTFLPTQVKKEQFSDVARFLHIVNKELDVPGFCIDETSSTVFYRLIVPTVKKELSKEIFEALLNTSQVVCKTFSPPVEAMGQGLMTLAEVLKKAEAAKAAT